LGKPPVWANLAQTTLIFSKNIAMGKYRKDEMTLGNALKVVEALLTLADEEITVPGDKLKATFKLEWVKEDELQVSGTVEQKRKNKIQPVEKGITKDDLWTLVECIGERLELSPSKDGMKRDSPEKRKQAVQDVLDCLTDLKLLEDKRRHGKNDKSGYWKFHLKLKHQTKRKENLKLIQEKWKVQIGQVPDLELETPTKKPINWREICQRNLTQQKELTTNPFTNAYGISPKLDKVYVPLAIVERKPPKPKSNKQPEEAEKETLIPIEEDRFFEDVLRQGKSEISQGRKIAIIGEPGSGKTTRLQKIADWILDQDLGLPIWVSLTDLSQATVYQYLEEIWLKQTGENLTLDALKPEKNRIWLLFDGLDEMTSKIESRHVSALLGGWLQDARVVVTCRVNVWEADQNAFSGFDVFRNLEFSRKQVNQYIDNLFTEIGDAATGESLEKELAKSENLAFDRLIQNPLRLWMLCQIWQTGGGLPDTQAELYRQFVDWVYRWKAEEEILDQRSEIDTALARLALAAMEQKEEVSRFQLSENWIVKVLGSRKIFKAVEKLVWLNRIERLPEAIYVFYHATFQEYFAALAVDESVDYWDYFLPRTHVDRPVDGKEYRIFQPQWKQVILFWLGREDVADKEEFIEALVNFNNGCDGDFYKDRAFFLAAAGISEFTTCSRADAIVKQIVQWGFGYYDEEKQQWRTFLDPIKEGARETLPQTDRKWAIQELCQILKHPQCSKSTRGQAFESLGEIGQGNEMAIAALVKFIETTEDEDTRRKAAENLWKIDPGNRKKRRSRFWSKLSKTLIMKIPIGGYLLFRENRTRQ
jgi:energy-coupling factor transporter ATP-binding protein EcfA2